MRPLLDKLYAYWIRFKNDFFLLKDRSVVVIKNFSYALWETISGKQTEELTRPQIKDATLFGGIVLLTFLILFGTWAVFSSLDTAASASGKVIVANNRKTIQHLEGGIVKKIFVKEGSVVKEGEPLIQLDDTQAKAAYDLLHSEANNLYATEARLTAERDDAEKIEFPDVLIKQKNHPKVQKLMTAQENIFENNKTTLKGQLEILQERINQLDKQIESNQAKVQSSENQLALIEKELEAVKILDAKGLIEKPRLWALEREAAKLAGDRDETEGTIAQIKQKIGETQQQILTTKDADLQKTLKELSETQSKLMDVAEREKAAEDVLKRTIIYAQQSGTVVNLLEHTVGGVILPGKPILDIVPNKDELIIEARISPLDIDSVHPGLAAKVQLVAYKRRNMPWLDGTVTFVSADIFQDQQNNTSYYTARVVIPEKALSHLKNVKLYPGMPVQVMIIVDKRSPWRYFITPIQNSFTRAFREE